MLRVDCRELHYFDWIRTSELSNNPIVFARTVTLRQTELLVPSEILEFGACRLHPEMLLRLMCLGASVIQHLAGILACLSSSRYGFPR